MSNRAIIAIRFTIGDKHLIKIMVVSR